MKDNGLFLVPVLWHVAVGTACARNSKSEQQQLSSQRSYTTRFGFAGCFGFACCSQLSLFLFSTALQCVNIAVYHLDWSLFIILVFCQVFWYVYAEMAVRQFRAVGWSQVENSEACSWLYWCWTLTSLTAYFEAEVSSFSDSLIREDFLSLDDT